MRLIYSPQGATQNKLTFVKEYSQEKIVSTVKKLLPEKIYNQSIIRIITDYDKNTSQYILKIRFHLFKKDIFMQIEGGSLQETIDIANHKVARVIRRIKGKKYLK